MKLWTIQTCNVWDVLVSDGIWRSREPFVDGDFLSAYRWLVAHMQTRLGPRVLDDQMPIWVWRQWKDARRPKPDLRSRGHLPATTPGVRIELELDANRVLLSDFNLWHYVLNNWYLPASVGDGRRFDDELKAAGLSDYRDKSLLNAEQRSRVEQSWEKIFDLGWHNRAFTQKQANKMIQGVVWELRLDDVRNVTV